MPATANDLFKSGQLSEAVSVLSQEVRDRPTDVERRSLLAELCCVRGDLERADGHFELLAKQVGPGAQASVAWLRQLVHAEQWRQDFHSRGRAPALLGELSPSLRASLEASIALREGRAAEAAALLVSAEERRPRSRGTVSGVADGSAFDELAFDDWRDLDDVCAGVLEVLTSTGKYYWVPLERVRSLEFERAARPLDLVWRRCELTVDGGPQGKVWIPVAYAPLGPGSNDAQRLGRVTEWDDSVPGVVRGRGMRTFLFGSDARTVCDLTAVAVADGPA